MVVEEHCVFDHNVVDIVTKVELLHSPLTETSNGPDFNLFACLLCQDAYQIRLFIQELVCSARSGGEPSNGYCRIG